MSGQKTGSRDVVKLAPSILAADFALLGQQVAEAEQGVPTGSMST